MAEDQQISLVRGRDRPHVRREPPLPTLQKLVNAQTGASALTVLVNQLSRGESVPAHIHAVEEVLVVVEGSCQVTAGNQRFTANAGDAVIVPPGVRHGFIHAGHSETKVVAALASATALPD